VELRSCAVRRNCAVRGCCVVHRVNRCFGDSLRLKSCGRQNSPFSIFLCESMVRQRGAVAQTRLEKSFSQHCRRVRSVAAARRDASCDVSSARASNAFFRLPIRPRRTMTNAVTASHSTPPWPRMQKNSGGRGKSQSLARPRMQPVSCRTRMSLPAMPALVPIERKTSVTQCSHEAGDGEPEEARNSK
jgi:hypothetical protein